MYSESDNEMPVLADSSDDEGVQVNWKHDMQTDINDSESDSDDEPCDVGTLGAEHVLRYKSKLFSSNMNGMQQDTHRAKTTAKTTQASTIHFRQEHDEEAYFQQLFSGVEEMVEICLEIAPQRCPQNFQNWRTGTVDHQRETKENGRGFIQKTDS